DALQEAGESGRDFKLLYRDLLNFVRNLLLIAGGANEATTSSEERVVAAKFTYTELLRVANLLMKDDEVVNRAEHQRLAVEIALLKAATFPRLREVESVLSGAPVSAPAPAPAKKRAGEDTGAPPKAADPVLERLQKARPLLAGYLAGAKSTRV